MFDLGDDIILDNFRIPWLLWIQIFVMFLLALTILLSYFGYFALDSSPTCNSLTTNSPLKISPSYSPTTQAGENPEARREIARATSNRVRRLENSSERGGSFKKDLASSLVAGRFFHPCRYFNLAKEAFLKCLGLGSGSQNLSDKEHED